MKATGTDVNVGTLLDDRFEVTDVIAKSGMASLFKANDRQTGKAVATAAVHIGGRLQVVEAGRIVRLDPAGKYHAARAGFAWERGGAVTSTEAEIAAATLELANGGIYVEPTSAQATSCF